MASPLTQQSHHTSWLCLRVCWDCPIYLLYGWENKPISPFVIFFNFIRITQSPFTSWLLHSFHIWHVSQNLSTTDMCPMWTFEKSSIYNFVISEMYSWYSFGNQPVVTIAKVGFILYVHNSWWNISFLNTVISTNVYLNNNQQKELVIKYTLLPNLDYRLSIYLLNQVTLARSSQSVFLAIQSHLAEEYGLWTKIYMMRSWHWNACHINASGHHHKRQGRLNLYIFFLVFSKYQLDFKLPINIKMYWFDHKKIKKNK